MSVRSIVLFGLFAVVDAVWLWLALTLERLDILLLHYVGAFGVAYLAQPLQGRQYWSARQAFAALTALLLPGLGSGMACYWSMRATRAQGAWQDVPPQPERSRAPFDWGSGREVVPLLEVLDGADSARKKKALMQAQLSQTAVPLPVVRLGLDDPDPEVRYYATSLLSRLEAAHTRQVRQLEQALAREPRSTALWNRLAEAYRTLIETGLVDTESRHVLQEKRLAALEQSLALHPGQPLVGIERARTLLEVGRSDAAAAAARAWLAAGQECRDAALAVLIQVAYQRHDQAMLVGYIAQVRDVQCLPAQLQGLVQLWRPEQGRA